MYERAAFYEYFADAFGWTQHQVDHDNEAWYVGLLGEVHELRLEVRAAAQKQANGG